ncbi:MAG TPA: membrane protein insertion efficiency factor YidD [Arcobacter sp.]|nr:membrane protein insertion efficiency factor YidD [Arcobacter sp.]
MKLSKYTKYIALYPIRFYQKYLTVISFGSCRYIPSCSSYATIQFEKNNFFKAFFFTTIRILKCNQLFEGGFDHPKISCKLHNQNFNKNKIKYWLIPKENGKYLVIKNWERNRH